MKNVSPLIRAAVFVSDLEKSVDFYTDILGYEEVFFEGDMDDAVANELLGMLETSFTRVIILKQSGPNFGMTGLFEVTRPAPPLLEKTHEGCHIGEICMVFYCADLQEICDKLARHEAKIICAPKVLELKARAGQGHKEMTFMGPDGEMFNFIERSPDGVT